MPPTSGMKPFFSSFFNQLLNFTLPPPQKNIRLFVCFKPFLWIFSLQLVVAWCIVVQECYIHGKHQLIRCVCMSTSLFQVLHTSF
jgi:hypothetical protein